MTISAVVPDIAFAGSSGSGTMGPFSLVKSGTPIVFYSNSDLLVYRYDTTSDTAPVLLVEGTDYTLTGGPTAGSITLTSPQTGLLTDERLYVKRRSTFAQALDLVNGGNFSAANLERRLDVFETKLQELDMAAKSTIRFSMFDTDEIPATVPLAAVIGKVAYPTGSASAPTVGLLDAAALADVTALSDADKANLSVVAADLNGADTIGIVAGAIGDVEDVADNIADVSAVADWLDGGDAGDIEVTATGGSNARSLADHFASPRQVADFTGTGSTPFTSAAAAGPAEIAPGSYSLSEKVTGDFYPSPFATFTTPANFAASAVRGFLTDKDADASIYRVPQRLLISKAAQDFAGSSQFTHGDTWLKDEGAGFYHERAAHIGAVSDRGGIGVLGASRASDRYTINGAVVWEASTAYDLNDIVGYAGRLYTVTVAGTTSTSPPTHTSGSVVDGTATLTWLDYTYLVSIGGDFVGISDVVDGTAAWAAYFEGIRGADGGTVYAAEIAVKNMGSSDVTNNPYSVFPAGSTIGWYFAAGGDASLGAPTYPSTCAILIASNASTFNSGIVFSATGISSGGYAMKMAAISDHAFGWFNSSGQLVAAMRADATANNERTQLVFGNSKIELFSVGGLMGQIESAATAGTAADEHVRLIGYAAGNGFAEVRAGGTATDINLRLSGKGAGGVEAVGNLFAQTNKSVAYVLAASAVAIPHTGTTSETTLATVTIPAGAIGANGFVRVTTTWSHTSSGNAKNLLVRFGGTGGTAYQNSSVTATASTRHQILIGNRNSASSQVGMNSTTAGGFGSTNAAVATSSVNTGNAVDLVFRALLANSGETITLESYLVEVFYQE
jgi:hypothetical protein